MNKLEDIRLLDKDEYFKAKARADELYEILKPWLDYTYANHLKPDAPDGSQELLNELRKVGRNVYYTEFMNGVAY